MRKLVGVLIALTIVACDDDDPTDAGRVIRWTADVQGLAGFQAIDGEVEVEWTVGSTEFTAEAEISGDTPASVRPWHVHTSTCAAGGGIVGVDGDYPRLTVGTNGSATAEAEVDMALDTLASYHVNYHLSVAQMGTIIACGNLVRQGG